MYSVFSVRVYAPAAVARPRIDERRLDDVVPVRRPADEAPPIVHRNADAGVRVDPARKGVKPIAHDVARDDRVDLDAVDPARPRPARR